MLYARSTAQSAERARQMRAEYNNDHERVLHHIDTLLCERIPPVMKAWHTTHVSIAASKSRLLPRGARGAAHILILFVATGCLASIPGFGLRKRWCRRKNAVRAVPLASRLAEKCAPRATKSVTMHLAKRRPATAGSCLTRVA